MTTTFSPNTPVAADPNDDLTFVRCPTLTHTSMNGQTKGPSSILCDVPHYIQTAKSGRLFYAPAEKTYLKLNNKNKITLRQIFRNFRISPNFQNYNSFGGAPSNNNTIELRQNFRNL